MKGIWIFGIAIILLIIAYPVMYYTSSSTIEVKVESKERITTGSGESISSKYMVYTDKGVFECTDSWLFFKFNSSDVYSKFEEGETYKVKVAGWRAPFLSWYKNIISIKE